MLGTVVISSAFLKLSGFALIFCWENFDVPHSPHIPPPPSHLPFAPHLLLCERNRACQGHTYLRFELLLSTSLCIYCAASTGPQGWDLPPPLRNLTAPCPAASAAASQLLAVPEGSILPPNPAPQTPLLFLLAAASKNSFLKHSLMGEGRVSGAHFPK